MHKEADDIASSLYIKNCEFKSKFSNQATKVLKQEVNDGIAVRKLLHWYVYNYFSVKVVICYFRTINQLKVKALPRVQYGRKQRDGIGETSSRTS